MNPLTPEMFHKVINEMSECYNTAPCGIVATISPDAYYSLGDCSNATPCAIAPRPMPSKNPYDRGTLAWVKWEKKCMVREEPNKKENNMGYDESQLEIQKRNRLSNRLDEVKASHIGGLKDKFHMHPVSLKTVEEVNKALKDGRFDINPDYLSAKGEINYFTTGMLRAVDPARDTDGYKAAEKLVNTAYTAAKDKIIVLPLEKGLEALNTFEAATF